MYLTQITVKFEVGLTIFLYVIHTALYVIHTTFPCDMRFELP